MHTRARFIVNGTALQGSLDAACRAVICVMKIKRGVGFCLCARPIYLLC